MSRPLHELEPTSRFSDRGGVYARHRPGYPPEAIDAVVAGCGPGAVCADVGAGTGISARLVADRGVSVIAIEPNAGMRDAAEPHSRVEWRGGTAEATGLPDGSVDLVLCAQAFHWFDPDRALGEFRRVLRPRGRLCLVWNDRDERDPLTREYGRLILEASGDHPAARDRSGCGEVIFASPHFTGAVRQVFEHGQPLTLDGLIGRALSASYTPREGPRHQALLTGLRGAFDQHRDGAGLVTMRYRTRVYTATVA